MWKVIRDRIDFALLCSVIGQENSRHSLRQWDAKFEPISTWSPAFSRVFPRFRQFGCFYFEFSLVLYSSLYSVGDDWSPPFPPENRVIRHPEKPPLAIKNDWSIIQTNALNTGREINFFSDSHLVPKFFKVVANSKKVGRHFQRQTKSFFTLSAF